MRARTTPTSEVLASGIRTYRVCSINAIHGHTLVLFMMSMDQPMVNFPRSDNKGHVTQRPRRRPARGRRMRIGGFPRSLLTQLSFKSSIHERSLFGPAAK